KARVFLLTSVYPDYSISITTSDTSAEAWKHFADRYNRDTGNTAINYFRRIISIRYNDGDNLREYLDGFHRAWL
ncbi:hypothetical protein K490DRAFT_34158, partial [Saccharata proteae CBS 121410]